MWSGHIYHLCLALYEANETEVQSTLLLMRRDIEMELVSWRLTVLDSDLLETREYHLSVLSLEPGSVLAQGPPVNLCRGYEWPVTSLSIRRREWTNSACQHKCSWQSCLNEQNPWTLLMGNLAQPADRGHHVGQQTIINQQASRLYPGPTGQMPFCCVSGEQQVVFRQIPILDRSNHKVFDSKSSGKER